MRRLYVLPGTLCAMVAVSMLLLGCGPATPGVVEVPVTVVLVTATAPGATLVPEATALIATPPPVEPITSVPPSPTPLPPTVPLSSPTAPTTTPSETEVEAPYDNRGSAVRLMASYFDAVNRREYPRAWGYWEDPPNPTYEDFVQGYSETASVLLTLRPPTQFDGAAGSTYAAIPTLLIATHTDATQHVFVGCYVARRPNAEPAEWSLYSASVARTPGISADATLLADACDFPPPGQPEPQYDIRDDPFHLLASYFNAVNRQEYPRAWEYWLVPPNPSYEDFVQGYAETESVLLVVRPPERMEGAAGQQYASMPALLIATHTDASRHAFVGCYVATRPNPAVGGGTGEDWLLHSATISIAPGNAADASLLADACGAE